MLLISSRKFETEVVKRYNAMDIVVEYPQTEQLRSIIAELLALEKIQSTYQELQHDPIAQHEVKDRYQVVSQLEEIKFSEILDHPENSHWYWKGGTLAVTSKRHLQLQFSNCMEEIFHAAPIIKNELINRIKPSSQASAGRNKLLYAMATNADKEDSGIDKFLLI